MILDLRLPSSNFKISLWSARYDPVAHLPIPSHLHTPRLQPDEVRERLGLPQLAQRLGREEPRARLRVVQHLPQRLRRRDDLPVAEHGYLDIPVGGDTKRIRIRRLHLEEDAGKNLHDVPGCTLVDLNRAGTPLMEIVTEPDIASAEEAYIFATELQRLVGEAVAGQTERGAKAMGAVMKTVMARAEGRADGKQVQEAVRRALGL